MIAGACLGKGNYYAGTGLGKHHRGVLWHSCKGCNASAFGSAWHEFPNSVSVGDGQFPRKGGAWAPARFHGNEAAKATGNGGFTGGNRAEDVNEALSTVSPHTSIEKDSAAFRAILAAIASVALAAENQRQQDKTDVPVDALRQCRLVESQLVYRQTFVIRSYEIGADRTASIETMMNHFQVIFPPPLLKKNVLANFAAFA